LAGGTRIGSRGTGRRRTESGIWGRLACGAEQRPARVLWFGAGTADRAAAGPWDFNRTGSYLRWDDRGDDCRELLLCKAEIVAVYERNVELWAKLIRKNSPGIGESDRSGATGKYYARCCETARAARTGATTQWEMRCAK